MSPNEFSLIIGTPVVLINLAIWVIIVRRILAGQHPVDLKPRWLVPWGLVDVFGAILVTLFFGPLSIKVLESVSDFDSKKEAAEQSIGHLTNFFFALSVGSLVAAILCVIVTRIRVGANHEDFGVKWSLAQIRHDVMIGVAGFLALVVPVLGIQFALGYFFEQKTQHPFVVALQQHEGEVGTKFWLVLIFSAVLVAPIVEELLIRVIFQGWLENIASGKMNEFELLGGLHSRFRSEPVPEIPGMDDELSELTEQEQKPATHHYHEPKLIKVWPIFVSAMLFAAMHWSHGPDPYPLFVLAVGLGYVYHTTHRILPCIVIHLLLNATSVAVMWYSVTYGGNGS